MAEPVGSVEGPVSETRAPPSGAKLTENAPGPALGFITVGDGVLSPWTLNTSMSLVKRSTTTRNLPSGLNAERPGPDVLVERNRV